MARRIQFRRGRIPGFGRAGALIPGTGNNADILFDERSMQARFSPGLQEPPHIFRLGLRQRHPAAVFLDQARGVPPGHGNRQAVTASALCPDNCRRRCRHGTFAQRGLGRGPRARATRHGQDQQQGSFHSVTPSRLRISNLGNAASLAVTWYRPPTFQKNRRQVNDTVGPTKTPAGDQSAAPPSSSAFCS